MISLLVFRSILCGFLQLFCNSAFDEGWSYPWKFFIVLSRYVMDCLPILMGIALNLSIAFGKITIILILPIQENGRLFHLLRSSLISFFLFFFLLLFVCLFVCFWGRVLLCIPDGLQLEAILLPLPPQELDASMCHPHLAPSSSLNTMGLGYLSVRDKLALQVWVPGFNLRTSQKGKTAGQWGVSTGGLTSLTSVPSLELMVEGENQPHRTVPRPPARMRCHVGPHLHTTQIR